MASLPLKMHTPFDQPIAIKPGHGLPRFLRTPADAYVALDGHGPDGLAWTVIRSGLTTMRTEGYDDIEAMRRHLADALWVDGMLAGH